MDHCDSPGPVYDLAELVTPRGLVDPEQPSRLLRSDRRRTFIYAVDRSHRVRIGVDGIRGSGEAVKHETLFHNDSVLAAGEMFFDRGVIVSINDRSGSYGTGGQLNVDRRFARSLLAAFDAVKAPVDAEERSRLLRKAGYEPDLETT